MQRYAKDISLDALFLLVPMRARLEDGHLGVGRRWLIEYAVQRTLDYSFDKLIVAISAEKYFKGLLEDYNSRALAVYRCMEEMAAKINCRRAGYVENAGEDEYLWPHLRSGIGFQVELAPKYIRSLFQD